MQVKNKSEAKKTTAQGAKKRKYGAKSTYSHSGRLIKDAESFEVEGKDGPVKLVTLTMADGADDERYYDLFPEITVGGPRVEFLGSLKKGAVVRVEGKAQIRTYERNNPKSDDIRDRVGVAFEIRFPRVVEVLWTERVAEDELPTEGAY